LVTPDAALGSYVLINPNVYLEDSYPTETGKWVVNGVANYSTYDGTHPNSVGHALAVAAVPSL
jgi:hypothetical protein